MYTVYVCVRKRLFCLVAPFYTSHKSLFLSVSPAVFSPLLRLSPPPSDHDYIYNLDETEGLCDLFDVPILNL